MREFFGLRSGKKGFSEKKRHNAEQIVLLLREADVEFGKGERVPEVCRKLGITQQAHYRWRTKYGSRNPKLASASFYLDIN